MDYFYKVQNKANPELFHRGGSYAIWNKKGKVWTSLGALRSFLTLAMRSKYNNLADWRVIEYSVTVKEVKEVAEVINPERLVELLKK